MDAVAISQTLLWTAIPRGFLSPGVLKVDVFVSPRLEPRVKVNYKLVLSAFTDFLNWPETIKNMKFRVLFSPASSPLTAQSPEGIIVDNVAIQGSLNSSLWQAIFTPTTTVNTNIFANPPEHNLLSYQTASLSETITKGYTQIGCDACLKKSLQSDSKFMTNMVKENFTSLAPVPQENLVNLLRVSPKLDNLKSSTVMRSLLLPEITRSSPQIKDEKTIQMQVVQKSPSIKFQVFHLPVTNVSPPKTAVQSPLQEPEIDFHKMLSLLTHYPKLLSSLGLVISLAVPVSDMQSVASLSRIRVIPTDEWLAFLKSRRQNTRQSVEIKNLSPWTRYSLVPGFFMASSRPGFNEIQKGILVFRSTFPEDKSANANTASNTLANSQTSVKQKSPYSIIQMDVDGAAIKVLDLLATIANNTTPTNGNTNLPSLRSDGISIIRNDRETAFKSQMEIARANNLKLKESKDGSEIEVYAEDIISGYRLDVWDNSTSRWFTLSARIGQYNFLNNGQSIVVEDEGYVSPALTQSQIQAPTGPSTTLSYLHEAIIRWTGWSLSVPKPGNTIVFKEDVENKVAFESVEQVKNKAATQFKFEVNFVIKPKSLPRLRFA
jgi:hypothetical protein